MWHTLQKQAFSTLHHLGRVVALVLLLQGTCLHAEELRVAVASNFAPVLKQLATNFEKTGNHKLLLSVGSSGNLYTQISNGAPFDLFFSADNERPEQLVAEKKAIAGTVNAYAMGKLVLWSPQLSLESQPEKVLQSSNFNHLAIANPKLAPYGLAARQVLEKMQLWQAIQPRLVLGENISQTLQFIDSRNAELGFIAESQWLELAPEKRGKPWQVPVSLHDPIQQDMVIIRDGVAARALHGYLQSDEAKAIIKAAGYYLP